MMAAPAAATARATVNSSEPLTCPCGHDPSQRPETGKRNQDHRGMHPK